MTPPLLYTVSLIPTKDKWWGQEFNFNIWKRETNTWLQWGSDKEWRECWKERGMSRGHVMVTGRRGLGMVRGRLSWSILTDGNCQSHCSRSTPITKTKACKCACFDHLNSHCHDPIWSHDHYPHSGLHTPILVWHKSTDSILKTSWTLTSGSSDFLDFVLVPFALVLGWWPMGWCPRPMEMIVVQVIF